MKDNTDLHTTFCHKCGLWMEFPYEEDGKLYHQWCLSQTSFKTSVEKLLKDSTTDNYIKVKTIAPDTLLLATRIINIDEACKYIDPETYYKSI